jgi:hypothetical protein
MGHSSLLGTETPAVEAPGRDTAALGPGDSSDSGSDIAGLEDADVGDPGEPVDVALRDDAMHTLVSREAMDSSSSDAAGTGERRSAGNDAGAPEGNDVAPDRIFDDPSEEAQDDPDDGLLDDDADAAP